MIDYLISVCFGFYLFFNNNLILLVLSLINSLLLFKNLSSFTEFFKINFNLYLIARILSFSTFFKKSTRGGLIAL